jgi:hypothetical protein
LLRSNLATQSPDGASFFTRAHQFSPIFRRNHQFHAHMHAHAPGTDSRAKYTKTIRNKATNEHTAASPVRTHPGSSKSIHKSSRNGLLRLTGPPTLVDADCFELTVDAENTLDAVDCPREVICGGFGERDGRVRCETRGLAARGTPRWPFCASRTRDTHEDTATHKDEVVSSCIGHR